MPVSDPLSESIASKKSFEKEKSFEDILKMLAPGTSIRAALDDLLRARMGALIVFETPEVLKISEKGFRIHSEFSAQRLVELSKMDGAIIVSKDGKRILYANTLLVPDLAIKTRETGTRHKAAERTAKQTKTLCVAVSERKNKISVYYGDQKHELEKSSEILRRVAETIQILEKQREVFDDLLKNFNILEVNNLVTITDVSAFLQRFEIIDRIAERVKRDLIELGKEGMIVSMRLKELTSGLLKEQDLLLRDYFGQEHERAMHALSQMSFDFLLETPNISRVLFEELHDRPISPSGIRILSKTNVLDRYVQSLIATFKTLDKIMSAREEELLDIFENRDLAGFFMDELLTLKEKIMVGKLV